MAQAHTLTEMEIRLFERPRKLPFRGRSFKTLSAFLRRGAKRSGPRVEGIADEEGPPPLPKADDELSRELRRLIGAESHKEDLHLGHPPEELSELLLDMSFLAQEAMEDGEVSGLLDRIREEHEQDALYRDLHSRYLMLMERTSAGDQ